MNLRRRSPIWTLAAVPYLLLSASQQAGVITHLNPDGSGERLVYARGAVGRGSELDKYLTRALPGAEFCRQSSEGGNYLTWRDTNTANLAKVSQAEVTNMGILQSPFSIFSTHVWKEALTFDRGDATEVEVHGQELAQFHYIVRMPGTITTSTPPGKVEGNRVEWEAKIGPEPQTFTVESRTVRWAYLILWIYVLAFVVTKCIAVAPRVLAKVRRKPKRI
ncbi:hypothetical protein LLH03_17940 [bacterium]|nr:hypothetical protein [bacterium]